MKNYFVFNGQNSLDFNIGIEQCPEFPTGTREVEKVSVPGRSGALIIDRGTFGNYTQQYSVYIKAKKEGLPQMCKAVALWLQSGKGYQRLEDSYDPAVYRRAAYVGGLNIENWMLQYGRATLDFDCKPQRYFKSGEQTMTLTKGQTVHNPGMDALPLFTITGSGTGQLTVGDISVNISKITGGMMLDCETQDAYKGTTNLNSVISLPAAGFPKIPAGGCPISWAGGITGVQMLPRWWTL